MVITNIVHYYTKRAGCDEYRILIRMNIRKYLDEKMIQMNIQTELDSHEEIELNSNPQYQGLGEQESELPCDISRLSQGGSLQPTKPCFLGGAHSLIGPCG